MSVWLQPVEAWIAIDAKGHIADFNRAYTGAWPEIFSTKPGLRVYAEDFGFRLIDREDFTGGWRLGPNPSAEDLAGPMPDDWSDIARLSFFFDYEVDSFGSNYSRFRKVTVPEVPRLITDLSDEEQILADKFRVDADFMASDYVFEAYVERFFALT